ncbi:cyclin-dependent kinase 4 inhibitor D isoform X1 [Strongylocentrotus purpuratus]|uniref:Uncharacterized protein n=1 Tax=Strongylocentrotus purpuratus TaxID=7668 RepID=A0A7M7HP95_STRPU|nr:cyclin-dependent kinase 4 inhibitor D isoform X1 [Strongylocentrotus purpuratus]|eukprot:XP_011682861.1 PREDICTED: cyclin-dependent kinase 4 inhibitor D isoform X2 [Strongylocentrotus purpuratus]
MAEQETIDAMTSAAAKADDAALVKILDGAPPGIVNRPNIYDRTAIQVMNSDSPSTARILIDHGADLDRPDPSVQRTILHDIAERGCIETLNLLLEHGANATARDNMGNTPAHLAAEKGGSYRIQILDRLSQNCTLTEVNAAGKTPLDLANEGNHREVVEWLQNFYTRVFPLQFLVRRVITMRVRVINNLHNLLPSILIDYLHGRRPK